jgi:hypothetical protein
MRHLLVRVPLLIVAVAWVLATFGPANSGSTLPAGVASGEHVVWLPDDVDHIERSLVGEMRDPVTRAELAQIVYSESRARRIDPLYVLAIMKVESGFRADAVSPRGAVGLMQVKPVAARSVMRAETDRDESIKAARLRDPKTNVALGVRYLQQLEEQFSDRETVLAAYNMGPTRVRRRLAARQPVPRGYAKKVLSTYRAFQAGADS